jgi:perosamine synthetase
MTSISHNLAEAFLKKVKSVSGESDNIIPLHEPDLQDEDKQNVLECLDSTFVSTYGTHTPRFDKELEAYTGAAEAVSIVNGTSALHMCLLAAGVEEGDEVVLPSLSFVATANAVSYCGAIPHFVDVDPINLCISPERLGNYFEVNVEARGRAAFNRNTSRRIRALIVMHAFGHPADLQALKDVCEQYGIILIEDAAQGLGSFYKNQHVGFWGCCGALSFNGNKIITTGGGGALLTNDHDLASKVRHAITTAKIPHPWEFYHDEVAYNYRMPNLNASLGLGQLKRIEKTVAVKRKIAEAYFRAFEKIEECRFVNETGPVRSNYWLCTVVLDPEKKMGTSAADLSEDILTRAHSEGLHLRPVWRPLHLLPMYRDCPRDDLSMTEFLAQRIVTLPSSPAIGRRL